MASNRGNIFGIDPDDPIFDTISILTGGWIGLGAAKGRIEFDDQATDEINLLDANVGIGTNTPAGILHTILSAGKPAIFGGGAIATLTGVAGTDASPTVLTLDATIDDGVAVGDLVIINSGTNATVGEYRVVSIAANTSVTLDRNASSGGAISAASITYVKDVIVFGVSDGTNGQRIMNYSHQDKPLQIGGDTLAATGHSLGSEDVLIGGLLEIDGAAWFDSTLNVSNLTQFGTASGAGQVNITPASAITGLYVNMGANVATGIDVNAIGAMYGIKVNTSKFGLRVNQTVDNGTALNIQRNTTETDNTFPLATFSNQNAAHTMPTVFIDHNGTGGAAGYALHVDSENAAAPAVLIESAYFAATTVGLAIGDVDTGIGQSAADQMSLIAGGVEFLELVEGTDDYMDAKGHYINQLQNIPDLASKGAACWFDGVDDYIFVGDSDQLTMVTAGEDNAFSIVVLAQFNATSGNYSIFGKYNGAAASEYEFLVSSNLLYVNALESDAGDKVGRSAPFTSTTRNWLAAVYTGSETSSGFSLYLNGNEISTADDESGTYTGMSNTNANVMIGRRDNNTLPFNGQISRTLLFNLALTAAEVRAYSSGAPVPFKYIGASQTLIVPSDDAGDDDTGNWTDVNGALTHAASEYTFTVTTGASVASFTDEAELTVGKRYRATVQVKDGTGAGATVAINAQTNAGAELVGGTEITVAAGYAIATVEWTATETNNKVSIEIVAASVSDGETVLFDTITTNQIGAVLQLEQAGIKAGIWVDSSGNDLHGALSGAVPINLKKGENQLLSIKNVSFAANADTALLTVPAGYGCILDHAKIVAGADAVSTDITIGQNGAESDFIPTNQMDNLNAADDAIIVMPIPSLTPLINKKYAAGTLLEMNVANQAGGATNTVYLYGMLT